MFTKTRVCPCAEKIQAFSPPSSSQTKILYAFLIRDAYERISFLGSFVILRKAIISFVVSACLSVCPSVRPHGTTWPALEGFLLSLIFENLSQICGENSILIKIFTWRPVHIFDNTSLSSS